jgi:hypothetical protein
MDPASFLNKIAIAVATIDRGRRGLTTDGDEHEGRLAYEDGFTTSLNLFKDAAAEKNCQILLLAELVFLQQELHFCDKARQSAINSLNTAIQGFEDALGALEIVKDKDAYTKADDAAA